MEWLLPWCRKCKPKLTSFPVPVNVSLDQKQINSSTPIPKCQGNSVLCTYFLIHSLFVSILVSYYLSFKTSFLPPHGSASKKYAYNGGDTGDMGSIPGSRRSPEVGKSDPLQYSCLKNLLERRACGLQFMGSQRVRHD